MIPPFFPIAVPAISPLMSYELHRASTRLFSVGEFPIAVVAGLSFLAISAPNLWAQCCGGSGGSLGLGDSSLGTSTPAARQHVRVKFTGSTPAVLRYGDYTFNLPADSHSFYDLPTKPETIPPLPGEKVSMSLENPDSSAYTGNGTAEVGDENQEDCPEGGLTTQERADAEDEENPKLDQGNPNSQDTPGPGAGDAPPNEAPPEPGGKDSAGDLPGGSPGKGVGPVTERGLSSGSASIVEPTQYRFPASFGNIGGGLVGDPSNAQSSALSLDVTFPLGPRATNPNRMAGYLLPRRLNDLMQVIVFNPLNLDHYRIRGASSGVTEYSVPNGRSIKVPTGLVTQTLSGSTMTFAFYNKDQIINTPPEGSGTPVFQYSISALPSNQKPNANYRTGWQVIKVVGGITTVNRTLWTSADDVAVTPVPNDHYWMVTDSYPGSSESRVQEWASTRVPPASRQVTMKIRRYSGVTLLGQSEKQTNYTLFSSGQRVTREIIDPSSANLWTDITYWSDAVINDPNYGREKLRVSSDGSWRAVYYERNAGTGSLIQHHFSPWINLPAPPAATATIANLNSLKSTCRYRNVERTATYGIKTAEYVKDIQVSNSETDDAGSSLRQMTKRYASASEFLATLSIRNSGHILTDFYQLKRNTTDETDQSNLISHTVYNYTTADENGAVPYYTLSALYTDSHPYRVVETSIDPERVPYRRQLVISDKATGREIGTESYIVDAGGLPGTLIDRRFHVYDAAGRRTFTQHYDGRQETWGYDTATAQITYTDASGVVRISQFNNFGFPKVEAVAGSSAAATYNGPLPAGTGLTLPARPWVVTEYASSARPANANGTVITATTTARSGSLTGAIVTTPGSANWQRSMVTTYDGADRVIEKTDGLGTTRYTLFAFNADGTRTTTTSLTSNGTNPLTVWTQNRDGQTASVTGNAQVAAYYRYDAPAAYQKLTETSPPLANGTPPSFTTVEGRKQTYRDGLDRIIYEIYPRSCNGSGVLNGDFGDVVAYDDYNNQSSWRGVSSTGGFVYQVQASQWASDASYGWKRRIQTATSTDATLSATDTNQRSTESWLEFSGGLWWQVSARYSSDGTAATNLISQTRTVLGPMNALGSGGYAWTKITAYGTTEEKFWSFDSATGRSGYRHTRNGTQVNGVDSFAGLPLVQQPLDASPAKVAAFSPLREPLHETSPTSIFWPILTRTPGNGKVQTRTGPGVSESYLYYTGQDYRAGRLKEKLPLAAGSGPVRFNYNERGQVTHTWGTGTYPVVYQYDVLGRMTAQHTFRSTGGFAVNPETNPTDWAEPVPANISTNINWDTTTWAYPNFLNLQLYKEYEAAPVGQPGNTNRRVSYSYRSNGLLATRTWQRGVVTTYVYNSRNQLGTISYSDGTPSVTGPAVLGQMAYDAAGFLIGRIDAGGTWTLTYRTDGLRLSESSTSGRAATWTMNAQGRRYSLTAQAHTAAVGTSPYMSYDSRGRFSGATSYTNTAPYYHGVTVGYRAGTYLPASRTYGVNFVSTLSESLGYDAVGQMNSRSFANSTNQILQTFAPTYDQGRVSQVVREGSQKWAYSYDARQQVAQGWKQFTTGALEVLEGTQNQYTYDLIGNRNTWSEGGGSMLGVGLRPNTYGAGGSGNSADSLNRYASIGRTQFFDVTGQRAAGSTILVNGGPPTYQQGANGLYFRKEVAANASARYTATTVTANGVTTDAWNQYVAPTSEPYTYDADGNLFTDSRWNYTWDAENRLTSATSQPQANPPLAVNGVKAEFIYDGLSRRIEKKTYQNSSVAPTWVLNNWELYAYDGWNLVTTARRNNDASVVRRVGVYCWGPDLGSAPLGSTTWQAAGGVGGFLFSVDYNNAAVTYSGLSAPPADPTDDHYFPCQDRLGNITGIMRATSSQTVLESVLDYDPFGREIRATGTAAKRLPFHFSSKFTDFETGLAYYGYRYYDPRNGRWPNRDPIGSKGGSNAFCFVSNSTINRVDVFGLFSPVFQHGKCVVVIDIGHNGSHLNPVDVPNSCLYGAVGCYDDTNQVNEAHQDNGSGVPGMPSMTEPGGDPADRVGPDQIPRDPRAPPESDGANGPYPASTDGFEQMLKDIEARAIDAARGLCGSPHCCRSPEVKFNCNDPSSRTLMRQYGLERFCDKNFAVPCNK